MITDITERLNPTYDPAVIIADMIKAAKFFADMLRMNLTIETYPDENRFEVVDAGIDVMIDEGADGPRIFLSTVVVTPGRMYMSNGDPGYPDDVDYIEEGEFSLDKKNDAIDRVIGLIAIRLFHMKGEAEAEAKFFEDLEAEREAANNGEPWEIFT